MTKEEARIIILEDALRQAQWTVEFLHGCLVYPDNGEMKGGYEYAYPEQTLDRLQEWRKLVPLPKLCNHSYNEIGCESCKNREEERTRLYEAKKVLSLV